MYLSSALLILTLCCNGQIFADSSDNSCRFIDSPGYTFREGTLYVEEGSNLDIYCVLNLNHSSLLNRTVNDLFFTYNSIERMTSNNERVQSNNERMLSNIERMPSNSEIVPSNNDKVLLNNEKVPSNNDKVISNNDRVTSNNEKVTSNNEKVTSNNDKVRSNNEKVTSQYITILNDTTIKLQLKNVTRNKSNFSCKLKENINKNIKETIICSNDVIIDTKPKNITDFKCEFRNWVNVTCNWTNPINYDSHTTYELKIEQSRFEDTKTDNYIECPEKYKTPNSCFLSLTTEPMFRRQARAFFFEIQGNNTFGLGYKVPFKVLHFQNILFDPPKHLKIVNITWHSAEICWEPFAFPDDLMYKIESKTNWDSDYDSKVVIFSSKSSQMGQKCTQIGKLHYSGQEYEVKVYVKSALAVNESFWSLPSNITFKTIQT